MQNFSFHFSLISHSHLILIKGDIEYNHHLLFFSIHAHHAYSIKRKWPTINMQSFYTKRVSSFILTTPKNFLPHATRTLHLLPLVMRTINIIHTHHGSINSSHLTSILGYKFIKFFPQHQRSQK